MHTRHWIAALALTTVSFAAGCAVDATGNQGDGTSSTASADTVFEASASTRAATGIAYYAFKATGNGKALAADGAAIATFDVASESAKSVLRIDAHGRQVEIVYAIETAANIGVDGTVDGTPFHLTFAKDGTPTGGAPAIDPALNAVLRGMSNDLMAKGRGRTTHPAPLMPSSYCGGLWDAIEGAQRAGEWLSVALLVSHWRLVCVE